MEMYKYVHTVQKRPLCTQPELIFNKVGGIARYQSEVYRRTSIDSLESETEPPLLSPVFLFPSVI